jgi:hypothetical protein
MLAAACFSEVLNAFSKFSEADSHNMSKVVGEFADLDGSYKAKVDALEATMERGQWFDEVSGQRGFEAVVFRHNERVVMLTAFDENTDVGSYQDGVFWEYNNFRLKMKVNAHKEKHVYLLQYEKEAVVLVAENIRKLAELVVETLHADKFCELCGQGLDGTPGPVCRGCGMSEMEKPCLTCKRRLGRATLGSREAPEHPCCKRRRLK